MPWIPLSLLYSQARFDGKVVCKQQHALYFDIEECFILGFNLHPNTQFNKQSDDCFSIDISPKNIEEVEVEDGSNRILKRFLGIISSQEAFVIHVYIFFNLVNPLPWES